MTIPTAKDIFDLLYDTKNGFLIKYHFKKGLDKSQLNELYKMLEILKDEWKYKNEIPKSIMFHLITIVPVLYRDLPLYSYDDVLHCKYEELIDNLDSAIQICLNSNHNDPFFNKALNSLTT